MQSVIIRFVSAARSNYRISSNLCNRTVNEAKLNAYLTKSDNLSANPGALRGQQLATKPTHTRITSA